MKMLRMLGMGLVLAGLVGCAATPKPEMPDNIYYQAAADSALLDKCGALGWISPSIAATGFNNISRVIKTYTFDSHRLNTLIPTAVIEVTQASCNKIAIIIEAAKQYEDQVVLNNQKTTTGSIPHATSMNTFCHLVGATVLCNSF